MPGSYHGLAPRSFAQGGARRAVTLAFKVAGARCRAYQQRPLLAQHRRAWDRTWTTTILAVPVLCCGDERASDDAPLCEEDVVPEDDGLPEMVAAGPTVGVPSLARWTVILELLRGWMVVSKLV